MRTTMRDLVTRQHPPLLTRWHCIVLRKEEKGGRRTMCREIQWLHINSLHCKMTQKLADEAQRSCIPVSLCLLDEDRWESLLLISDVSMREKCPLNLQNASYSPKYLHWINDIYCAGIKWLLKLEDAMGHTYRSSVWGRCWSDLVNWRLRWTTSEVNDTHVGWALADCQLSS